MKILIVEDEIGIANFLQQGLEEEGYTVLVANDGKTGLDLALSQKVNIILLDWILLLTAKDTVQETIEGLKAGANDYIKKPFSFDELVERIKIHFRHQSEPEILNLGPIEINLAKHLVLVEGVESNLTQREYELLCYLVRNKGKVCTRTQIIEDVWDIHFDYETGVIDVFMNAIRKKLNLKIDKDYIKTIRGVGYIAND